MKPHCTLPYDSPEEMMAAYFVRIRHASRKLHFMLTCDVLHYNEHRFQSLVDLMRYMHEHGDGILPDMDPCEKIESAWRN